jgi:hypothetical protein
MNAIVQFIIQSTWFKKGAAVFGGVALGMWVQASYYQQIADVCKVFGIDRDEYLSALQLIVGAAGVSLSVVLSVVKKSADKKEEV